MSAGASPENALSHGILVRALIYTALILFAIYYLLPLYVDAGQFLQAAGGDPPGWHAQPTSGLDDRPLALGLVDGADRRAADRTQALLPELDPDGHPAVAISTIVGALNGYVLTKWQFRGSNVFFGMLLLSCFIPFQIVLIPMARILAPGTGRQHLGADPRPRDLRPSVSPRLFPELLRELPDRAGARRADRRASLFQIFAPILLRRDRSSSSRSSGSSPISGTTSCSGPPSPAPIPRR